jgi:hypothetical protein
MARTGQDQNTDSEEWRCAANAEERLAEIKRLIDLIQRRPLRPTSSPSSLPHHHIGTICRKEYDHQPTTD